VDDHLVGAIGGGIAAGEQKPERDDDRGERA
jgi:hypothetical protein